MSNANNNVLLEGNLAQDPYFDRVEGSGLPFLRFYLAVSLPGGLARAFIKGNVVQPPYYNHIGDEDRPFLRMTVAVNRPPSASERSGSSADFLRVVAYDELAMFSSPYLQPKSEIFVAGTIRSRKRPLSGGKTENIVEIVAGNISYLNHINWEKGDAERKRLMAERDSLPQLPEREQGGGFFRVVAFGDLALLSYPYLQTSSEVLVQGHVRRRKLPKGKSSTQEAVVEIVAENIKFLRKIDWKRGDAERERIVAQRGPR